MKLAFALLISWYGVAGAQPAFHPVDIGKRVRVSVLVPPDVDSTGFHSRDRLTGSLLRYDANAITLSEGPTIPWAAVSKLDLSAGRHGNAGRGALYGALIGLLAGVVTGATIGRDEGGGEGNEDLEDEFGVGFGIAGLLFGGGIGAIVGGRLKTDDWLDVPLAPAPADSSR